MYVYICIYIYIHTYIHTYIMYTVAAEKPNRGSTENEDA